MGKKRHSYDREETTPRSVVKWKKRLNGKWEESHPRDDLPHSFTEGGVRAVRTSYSHSHLHRLHPNSPSTQLQPPPSPSPPGGAYPPHRHECKADHMKYFPGNDRERKERKKSSATAHHSPQKPPVFKRIQAHVSVPQVHVHDSYKCS